MKTKIYGAPEYNSRCEKYRLLLLSPSVLAPGIDIGFDWILNTPDLVSSHWRWIKYSLSSPHD